MKGKVKKLFGKDFAKNFQVKSTERIFEKAYGTFSRKNLVLNDLEPFLPLPVLTYMTIILIKNLT